MVSSALQGRNGDLAGAVGQGSGAIDHDRALWHACERAPFFFRYHSRKSSSLPTQAMMKVLALDRLLRFGALHRRLGNQCIFRPWRRCRRVDVSYFAQIPGGQRRRLTNDRNANPKCSVVNSS
jgi:hypothetical protein